jgi:NAD(P)H dehydrogenase (quinone)
MKALVVFAHQDAHSYNRARLETAVAALEGAGHEVAVSDLYAMGFEAAAGRGDFATLNEPDAYKFESEQGNAYKQGRFAAGLAAEQEKLARADFVLLQFPFWWFSLPAILKGWVDRVFVPGLAYASGARYDTGLLAGRRGMLSLTTASPEADFRGADCLHGDIDGLLHHINHGMLRYAGFDVLPPVIAWDVHDAGDAARKGYLEDLRTRLETIETAEPIAY